MLCAPFARCQPPDSSSADRSGRVLGVKPEPALLLEALDELGSRLRGPALEHLVRDLVVLSVWSEAPEVRQLPSPSNVFDVQRRTREFLANVAGLDADVRVTADIIKANQLGRLGAAVDLAPGWFPLVGLALSRASFSGALTVWEAAPNEAAVHRGLLELWDGGFATSVQVAWPPSSADLVTVLRPDRALPPGSVLRSWLDERIIPLVRPGGLLMLGSCASAEGSSPPEPWRDLLRREHGAWAVAAAWESSRGDANVLLRRGTEVDRPQAKG